MLIGRLLLSDLAPSVSVIICTHNPNRTYLHQTIEAILRQSLPPDQWELIVVDNNSDPPLESWLDLSHAPNARIVRELNLGLTHARMRGIREARAELTLLVDDDNVLRHDYLEHAVRIMTQKPFLGAIAGKCKGELEKHPPRWIRLFYHYLAILDHGDQARWINHPNTFDVWYPRGAGLVLRTELAMDYVRQLELQPERQNFDRRGRSLASAGDIDIVMTVMDLGYAVGYFPQLVLRHIIPASRMTFRYMRRMIFSAHYSTFQLYTLRGCQKPLRPWPLGYAASIVLCLLHGYLHPLTWLLSCEVAHGRYAARADLQRSTQGQTEHITWSKLEQPQGIRK